MDQLEATNLLGISAGASPEEVEVAFRQREREARQWADTARSRGMEAQYKDRCKALKDACGVLSRPNIREAVSSDSERTAPAGQPLPEAVLDGNAPRANSFYPEVPSIAVVSDLSPRVLGPGAGFSDRFILQRALGSGDEGGVWLAEDRRLNRKIALKLLPGAICRHPGALAGLKEFIHRSNGLVHRHIAGTYDFVVAGEIAAVTLEFVEGKTLTQLRGEQPGQVFEASDLTGWVSSLCEALEYAHVEKRLVHGGLRPDNLLVDAGGRLKLTGFGLAGQIKKWLWRLGSRSERDLRGWAGGVSEALEAEPSVSDDVFGVGATLYELLTGTAPFETGGGTGRKQLSPSMTERRATLAIKGRAIPPAWEETVAACLAGDPVRRPQTVGESAIRLAGSRPGSF
jgi:hypothetical protein